MQKPWTFNVKRPSVHDLSKLLWFRNALTPMPLIRIDASRIASESIANHYQLVNSLEKKKILVKRAFSSLTNQASPSDGGWKTLNTLIATTSPQGIHESWCNHCKTISRHVMTHSITSAPACGEFAFEEIIKVVPQLFGKLHTNQILLKQLPFSKWTLNEKKSSRSLVGAYLCKG